MLVKIIFFVLTGIILMYGTLVDATLKDVHDKCAVHKNVPTFKLCLLTDYKILNEDGEWNKNRLEDAINEAWTEQGVRAEVKPSIMKCADEGIGETLSEKSENFYKCIDKLHHDDQKFL